MTYLDSAFRVLDLAFSSFSLCFAFSVPYYAMKTEPKPGTVIPLQHIGGGRTSHGYRVGIPLSISSYGLHTQF